MDQAIDQSSAFPWLERKHLPRLLRGIHLLVRAAEDLSLEGHRLHPNLATLWQLMQQEVGTKLSSAAAQGKVSESAHREIIQGWLGGLAMYNSLVY